jgi:protein-disulfide isomerase
VVLPTALDAQTLSPDAKSNFEQAWVQQPRVNLGIPAGGAKVVIVKFNDFMCPSCRQAELLYKPLLEKFNRSNPGAVKYVVKDWPWNSSCNFNTASTISGHEAACNAAAAARMARDRGKYDEMVDWLYANQGTTAAAVRSAAERILGVKDFDTEYARKLPDIRRDIADGGVLRIDSTPTFFINGVRVGMIAAPYFELAVSLELKRAG